MTVHNEAEAVRQAKEYLREIGVLEEAPASQTMDTKLERDGLKMGVDPLAAGSLQGAKQQIAPRMFFLSFGHGGIVQVLVKSDSARLPDCGTPNIVRPSPNVSLYKIDNFAPYRSLF